MIAVTAVPSIITHGPIISGGCHGIDMRSNRIWIVTVSPIYVSDNLAHGYPAILAASGDV